MMQFKNGKWIPGEFRTFIDGKEAMEQAALGDAMASCAAALQYVGDTFKARNTTNAFVRPYDDFTIDSIEVREISPLEFFGYDTGALDDPDIRWLYQKYIWLTPIRLICRVYRAWRDRREWRG